MSYFLCGQTGNVNRGCEAIIRSTVKVLGQRNGDVYLATFAPEQDRPMVRELGINMIPYSGYPTSIHRYACGAIRKVFKTSVAGTQYTAESLYAHMQKGDISLNIGGDTYCYGRPLNSIALNRYTHKHGIDNILWCCSVEKDVIQGEIKKDLLLYKYIFAREQITEQNLLAGGIPQEKVIKVCDPAFFLGKKEVPLPKGFADGNTVGLNVSECVVGDNGDIVYENVLHMARYILQQTDMSVCLIPHVYSIEKNICDWPILNRIKADLNSDRVSIADKEYDCEQLKYIISNCRFMVCARTHASIAAYSSEVPTLVLGYSIKSKGIATDLFGTAENYVVSYRELTEKHELTEAFRFITAHEAEIREKLHDVLPKYKAQLTAAVRTYLGGKENTEHICDSNLCSGCGACASACPKQCIDMMPDSEGFLYPRMDMSVCIDCGKCRKVCPVANKQSDDGKIPPVYAAMHKNESVRLNSSSGGLFTAFAEQIIADGGVVFGAAFDKDFKVVHTYTETVAGLAQFRGSKYVQSEIGDAYIRAKAFLESGRKVLFTGTPCQIGGLYAYLNREYDNLITQDFICHGVPSPKIWDKYVKYRESVAASKTRRIFFRHKNYGWKRFSVQFEFTNCTEYIQVLTEDLYMRGFLAHLFLRPACRECSFKNVHRQSDITLADFWGVEKLYPDKNDDKGLSLVMLHNSKGQALFDRVRQEVEFWEVDFAEAIRENTSMVKSVSSARQREAFLRDAERLEMDKLIEKYCGTGIIPRARRFLKKVVR